MPEPQQAETPSTPHALPVVTLRARRWFLDIRLGELRHRNRPSESIKLAALAEDEFDRIAEQYQAECARLKGVRL